MTTSTPRPADRSTAAGESDAGAPLSAPDSPRTLEEAARVFVRHGSPRFLLLLSSIAVASRLAVGGFGLADAALAAGIYALWPLQEWLIHVFILHYEPLRIGGRTIDFAVPISHRAHHMDPWNIEILFIPVQGFVISLPMLLATAFLLAPTTGLALTGLAWYFLLSLRYEWVHFLVHTRYRPKSEYFRRLWRNHRLHHCKSERHWFGVTMLGGDRLLGTAPDPATTPLSATCRTLGIVADSEGGIEPA